MPKKYQLDRTNVLTEPKAYCNNYLPHQQKTLCRSRITVIISTRRQETNAKLKLSRLKLKLKICPSCNYVNNHRSEIHV